MQYRLWLNSLPQGFLHCLKPYPDVAKLSWPGRDLKGQWYQTVQDELSLYLSFSSLLLHHPPALSVFEETGDLRHYCPVCRAFMRWWWGGTASELTVLQKCWLKPNRDPRNTDDLPPLTEETSVKQKWRTEGGVWLCVFCFFSYDCLLLSVNPLI